MIKHFFSIFFLFIVFLCALTSSCKKESTPENPYSKVNYRENKTSPASPDSASFVGIHKNILSVKCANPSCHDGSFEPDYRTVQSSYSTLVYQPVKKNSPDSSFKYRVIPNDTSKSWLVRRLTTDDNTIGRMPLYSSALSKSELNAIYTWILKGARDMDGNSPPLPK